MPNETVFDFKRMLEIFKDLGIAANYLVSNVFTVVDESKEDDTFLNETDLARLNNYSDVRIISKKFRKAEKGISAFSLNLAGIFVYTYCEKGDDIYSSFIEKLKQETLLCSPKYSTYKELVEKYSTPEERENIICNFFNDFFNEVFRNTQTRLNEILTTTPHKETLSPVIRDEQYKGQLRQLLGGLRGEQLQEKEWDMLHTVINEYLLPSDNKLYYESFERTDKIAINEDKMEITKAVTSSIVLAANNTKDLRYTINRKVPYSGTAEDLFTINKRNSENKRREIFCTAYADITIYIGDSDVPLTEDECFKYFRIATPASKFREGSQSNLITQLVFDEALQSYNTNTVRIESIRRHAPKKLDGSSLCLVYRLPCNTENFKFSCMFSEETPYHWKFEFMPVLPGHSVNEEELHPYCLKYGILSADDPRSPSYTFKNWLPQGAGISYAVVFGSEFLLSKRKN